MTNSGFIGAEKIGIEGFAVSDVTNTSSGTITAVGPNGIGILGHIGAKVDNAGQIEVTDATGIAIKADITADVINRATGTITGGFNGIQATTTATVNNAGTIFGATGNGILSGSANIINTNTGSISGNLNGIEATTTATVNNAGSIFATAATGRAIRATTATVVNTANITAPVGIQAVSADVTNSGTISAGVAGNGVLAQTATVTNSGVVLYRRP